MQIQHFVIVAKDKHVASDHDTNNRKNPKNLHIKNIVVIVLKFEQCGFTI